MTRSGSHLSPIETTVATSAACAGRLGLLPNEHGLLPFGSASVNRRQVVPAAEDAWDSGPSAEHICTRRRIIKWRRGVRTTRSFDILRREGIPHARQSQEGWDLVFPLTVCNRAPKGPRRMASVRAGCVFDRHSSVGGHKHFDALLRTRRLGLQRSGVLGPDWVRRWRFSV